MNTNFFFKHLNPIFIFSFSSYQVETPLKTYIFLFACDLRVNLLFWFYVYLFPFIITLIIFTFSMRCGDYKSGSCPLINQDPSFSPFMIDCSIFSLEGASGLKEKYQLLQFRPQLLHVCFLTFLFHIPNSLSSFSLKFY